MAEQHPRASVDIEVLQRLFALAGDHFDGRSLEGDDPVGAGNLLRPLIRHPTLQVRSVPEKLEDHLTDFEKRFFVARLDVVVDEVEQDLQTFDRVENEILFLDGWPTAGKHGEDEGVELGRRDGGRVFRIGFDDSGGSRPSHEEREDRKKNRVV